MSVTKERGWIGESARRVDGEPKVTGEFAYGNDLSTENMLWGATARSPHVSARIVSLDASAAMRMEGVRCVLTFKDLEHAKTFGLEFCDQPVLAEDVIRYIGEPVAVVAAETPEQARLGAAAITVEYEPIPLVTDMEQALRPDAPRVHPFGNVLRHVHILHGDVENAQADVWVDGYYETAMQDQAALGPESTLAVPSADGGIDLYAVTQWIHVDRQQIAPCLGLPEEKVRITLAGVGGAFGSREDIHTQIHACLMALRTGRAVKMVYGREESFHGHVHRHPSRTWIRYGAMRDGTLVACDVRLLFDGGAYASSSPAVVGNAATFACGPYEVPNVHVEGTVVYTNNPPCGAMRGFGAPQICFAYEAAMDALAGKLGMDPLELRLKNAVKRGSTLPTGQVLEGPAPVAELIERCRAIPLPDDRPAAGRDPIAYPGGAGNVSRGEALKRGVAYAVGFKNIMYSEGFDDAAEATVTLRPTPDGPVASVRTAAVEYGQGLYTVLAQIVRTELGVEEVVVEPTTSGVGSAGSTSASRQTTMTGGAVLGACRAIREALLEHELAEPIARTYTHHHPPTTELDEHGQGSPHAAFAFVVQRAVVEVDQELGLVRVVQIATAQDAGRVINPQLAEGQVEGGTAQGLGLALTEEIQLQDGVIRNASFTDYLIPTILDVAPVVTEFVEEPDNDSPYGVKGVGELATVVSTAAVAAALRAATGRVLNRVPVHPDDLVGIRSEATTSGPAPVPDVPGQKSIPEYLGLGLGQQMLMKASDE
ncbi:MAG: xanthine dehydrogenase family protein molybdopterin-binding subunit [Gaiellaceae bacterium]